MLVARVDFLPDDTPLGSSFPLPGFRFTSAGNDLFVNETAGALGIQFPRQGMKVELETAVDRVSLIVGGFAGGVTVDAKDAAGTVVDQTFVPAGSYQNRTLSGAGIKLVEFTGGGYEGILVEISYEPCPA